MSFLSSLLGIWRVIALILKIVSFIKFKYQNDLKQKLNSYLQNPTNGGCYILHEESFCINFKSAIDISKVAIIAPLTVV